MIKTSKLVMIPGPTPVVRSIQEQMARETVAFGDAAFVKDFSDVVADLGAMRRGETFVVSSGTMGMEWPWPTRPGARVTPLVCSNGYSEPVRHVREEGGLTSSCCRPSGGRCTPAMVELALSSKRSAPSP